jgi:hypothetical protein
MTGHCMPTPNVEGKSSGELAYVPWQRESKKWAIAMLWRKKMRW